jgi:hypothetical protein
VAFNSNFWLAAGAAAPVIALANQVTLSGLLGWAWRPSNPQDPTAGLLLPFPLGKTALSWAFILGVLNLLLQTAAFGAAIFSLLNNRDIFSASLVGTAEVAGLPLILFTAIFARGDKVLRDVHKQVRDEWARSHSHADTDTTAHPSDSG